MHYLNFTFITDILMYSNRDIEMVVTPVDVGMYDKLLYSAGYDPVKASFLVDSFRRGFPLNYQGSKEVHMTSANLKLRVGNKAELWTKIMKEVKLG